MGILQRCSVRKLTVFLSGKSFNGRMEISCLDMRELWYGGKKLEGGNPYITHPLDNCGLDAVPYMN